MGLKRIVALRLKCHDCGKEMDYLCDARCWDGTLTEDKETYGARTCRNQACRAKLQVHREDALKNIYVKEGTVG